MLHSTSRRNNSWFYLFSAALFTLYWLYMCIWQQSERLLYQYMMPFNNGRQNLVLLWLQYSKETYCEGFCVCAHLSKTWHFPSFDIIMTKLYLLTFRLNNLIIALIFLTHQIFFLFTFSYQPAILYLATPGVN